MEVHLYNSTYCRLCAEENPSGVLLYSVDDSETDLSGLVNRYLPFKIQDDGKLPRTICPGCNIQLQATVQFFDLLVEGQKKIREMWKNQIEQQRKAERERLRAEKEGVESLLISSAQDVPTSEAEADAENRIVIQILADGTLFPADHEMALKMEGLERPRRKRGRPPKRQVESTEEKEVEKESESPEASQDPEEMEEDADGRRRRKRKVPQRFREAVQGKELERIFREEGVIDEDEPEEEEEDEIEEKATTGDHDGNDAEIIGHLETQEGQDLGELVIVNRGRGRGRPRGKRRRIRFQCEICGRGFQHKGRYIVHKSYHKGVKFECNTCNKRFSNKDNFDLHQKTTGHTGEGIIEGLEDGENTEDLASGNRYPCDQCEKTFQTKQSYEVHLKAIHEGQRPFACEVCGRSFAYHNSLKGHMLSHEEQKAEKGYPCDICGKMLNHPSSVVYHKEAEHNNGRRFVCNKCGKGFKHKQLLQRHQLVHSDDRPFVCKSCGASFKTKANLLNHQPTHTGEKKYFCELCGQQFAHKTSLTLHYRWHTGQKPYQCQVCNKNFSQNGNLQEHLRIHTGEKPFCCDYCGRKFTTSSQFKLHVKRHTGERPWKCEFCGKSFLHKDTWKCHTRRHKGERPFQCHFCARGFTEQWALKKHLRLHTGEKPYSCNMCGKAFADCSNLTKHKKVHRENKDGIVGAAGGISVDRTVWNIIRSHLSKEVSNDGNAEGEARTGEEGDGVQQIIYVTYQDPDDPSEARTLHIVDDMQADSDAATGQPEQQNGIPLPEETESVTSVGGIITAPEPVDTNGIELSHLSQSTAMQLSGSHSLHVTDEDGNPIQFTMQDGRQLQITTADGQSIQVMTTVDGQTIPLQLMTHDSQHITPEMENQLQHVGVENSEGMASAITTGSQGGEEDVSHLVEEEQAIEFMTQDGRKVRLVTSYEVDPLHLNTDYLATT
ncbi:hypothetical protein B7P43_G00537 [Cryptotermes secundus]|uniref:Uncharacterized protein n=2 Tax=Cryptotermes secundus TaxID=105785 RepID=A0A2J7R663_9NEOP|nr:zinc finger and SCAN domain-containing protein 2 isoform X1 [Cryptotermes secundus]PNF36325.1 hypothetical protein B7P43_G00537 [Cryptotermes secundus]